MPAAFRGGVASRCCFLVPLPDAAPCGQCLPDPSPWRISLRAASSRWRFALALPIAVAPRCWFASSRWLFATAYLPGCSVFLVALRHSAACLFTTAPPASIFPMALRHGGASHKVLCHGAPTSNKPHPAEKSTPVWLAIWHIWAGFANSQLQCATFHSTYSYKFTSSLLPTCNCCSDIANLSAHLHRLPTPPPYLRQMRLMPGRGRRCWMANDVVGCPCRSSCKSPRARILVLGTSGAHWPARWPQFCAREGPNTGVHTLRTFAVDSSCDCFATNR